MKGPDYTWLNRAENSIAQGFLTNSKRVSCLVKGIYPSHIKKGDGCLLIDTRGNKYVDFICGLGTNLLGYGNQIINQAIAEQLSSGYSHSLASTLEVEFAEKLKGIFPFIDRIKILKSGSEACISAIKIARAYTGRKIVVSDGYHGHIDEFVSLTPPALGCVGGENIRKLEHLGQIDKDVAAVIVEPVLCDASRERIEYLKQLRAHCTNMGAVLIFDEVITGFRVPKLSVTNWFNIRPDIIILGKAIANGMPLAVVGGKKDIMNCGEYFVSSTYAGETLSLAAAIRVMNVLETNKYNIEDLHRKGHWFCDSFNKIRPDIIKIEGYGTRGRFIGSDINKALFFQESCKANILVGPSFFYNFPLMDYSDMCLLAFKDILGKIASKSVQLEGELPQTPFAAKVRG